MKKDPIISIIIPVYNVEKYLSKCINSILGQNFYDFELILVDDGSSDTSGNICDIYEKSDSRVLVIHQANKGVSSARNSGLKHAKGKYIWFVDADDYINDVLYTINTILKNGLLDILIIDFNYVDSHENILTGVENIYQKITYDIHSGEYFIKEILNYSFYVSIFIFKRSLFIESKLEFDIQLKICEDLELIPFVILKASKVRYIDLSCYNYLQRENSALHSYNIDYIDSLCKIAIKYKKYIDNDKNHYFNKIYLFVVRYCVLLLSEPFYSHKKKETIKAFKLNHINQLYERYGIKYKIINFLFRYCPYLLLKLIHLLHK